MSGEVKLLQETQPLRLQGMGLYFRLVRICLSLAVPLGVWLAPVSLDRNGHAALTIAAFMIACWVTEAIDYVATGLIGLVLFWIFGVAKTSVIFDGFENDAVWFYLGAMMIGAMTVKSGLPQRIANMIISRVGVSYPRLLLGLIIVDFLLTLIVPSGAALLVIMASIALALLKVFDVQKGSNIGRGMFLILTYTTGIFNKMVVAGTATIVSRSIIEHAGHVAVSWSLWLFAFLPCSIGTIVASWWITLKLFPPERLIADRHEALRAHFAQAEPWTVESVKAAVLCGTALILYMLNYSPSIVSLAIGLVAMLPFVELLDEGDLRRINLMPFLLGGAALGMSTVLEQTGVLHFLTDRFVGGITPMLTGGLSSVFFLYWSGFFYHFATAHEVAMLASSMPILMEYANLHHADPLFIGMIWSFSSGGKLFAYQSSVLLIGYGYGFFRHTDLLLIGVLLTLVEFALLVPSVLFYWPMLGLR